MPKRGCYQFSLKTILLALTLVAAASLEAAGAEVWPRVASLPKRTGAVVRVTTVDQFTAAVAALKDGQTIVLAPGVYKMPRSITLAGASKVVVRGDGGDRTKVVLDFSESTHTEGIRFQRCRDVILADLTVQNVRQNGFKIDGDHQAENITIHNVVSRNVWQRHVRVPGCLPAPTANLITAGAIGFNSACSRTTARSSSATILMRTAIPADSATTTAAAST